MKAKRILDANDIDEESTSEKNRQSHYNKRIKDEKQFDYSEEEYEKRADELSRSRIDNKNIFGYISLTIENKNAYCKYNKNTEEFVVYSLRDGVPCDITMCRKTWREYTGDKAIEYFGEISD